LQCGAEPDPKMVEVFAGKELRNTKVFSDFGGEEEIEAGGAKRADGFEGILAGGLHVVALKNVTKLRSRDFQVATKDILF